MLRSVTCFTFATIKFLSKEEGWHIHSCLFETLVYSLFISLTPPQRTYSIKSSIQSPLLMTDFSSLFQYKNAYVYSFIFLLPNLLILFFLLFFFGFAGFGWIFLCCELWRENCICVRECNQLLGLQSGGINEYQCLQHTARGGSCGICEESATKITRYKEVCFLKEYELSRDSPYIMLLLL